MSRRVVAPVLLLIAAALSIAAVFAVHRIEAAGGPLSQPSAIPPAFSPDGDGIQDEVEISFTTRREERVSVRIEDASGTVVRTLVQDERVDGEYAVTWNGAGGGSRTNAMPDGTYRAVITRRGDEREYSPTDPIVLDTHAPIGVLDRATLDDGRLAGLAMLGPGETVVVTDADGTALDMRRVFRPQDPAALTARPTRPAPSGTEATRFLARVDGVQLDSLRMYAQDRAGNRRDLLTGAGASRIVVVP